MCTCFVLSVYVFTCLHVYLSTCFRAYVFTCLLTTPLPLIYDNAMNNGTRDKNPAMTAIIV